METMLESEAMAILVGAGVSYGRREAALRAAGGALAEGAGPPASDAFSLSACWQYAAGRLDERYAVLTEGAEKTARIELFLLCAAQDILEKTK